jgi:DNA-binding CsgD family transcriptional regulator
MKKGLHRPSANLMPLIGAIYDCAVDPDRWADTVRLIAEALRCETGSLTRLDRHAGVLTGFIAASGADPYWLQKHIDGNYAADAAHFFGKAMAHPEFEIDKPLVLTRDVPPEVWQNLRVTKEWARPQGFCDCMSVVVLDTAERLATVDMMRHERVGPCDDDAIAALRSLAPHLRRAVTVSDLFGVKRLEATALAETVDLLAQPVLLVDDASRIIFANAAADGLLAAGDLIRSVNGQLAVGAPAEAEALRLMVEGVGAKILPGPGTTQALSLTRAGTTTPAALAHVLPLTLGELGRRVSSRWVAAVVIAMRDAGPLVRLDGVADSFNLTGSELKLLERLVDGESVADAAANLGIEISTARTHLARLFAKTGTKRQAELVTVAARLASPLAR